MGSGKLESRKFERSIYVCWIEIDREVGEERDTGNMSLGMVMRVVRN